MVSVSLLLFLSLGFISHSLALGSLDGPTGRSGADLGNLVVRQPTLLRLEDEIDERFSLALKLEEDVFGGQVLQASFGVLCFVVHASLAHLLDVGLDVLLESLAILLRVVGGGDLFVGYLPKAFDFGVLGRLAESDDLTTASSAADFLTVVVPLLQLTAGTCIVVPVDDEAIVKGGQGRQ